MSQLNESGKQGLSIHPRFAVRLPLLPFKSSYTTEEMELLLEDPLLEEALYLASPDLLNTFRRYKSSEVLDEQELGKMWIAFHKYFTRMSSRPTPFGLFAGMAIGQWSENTNLSVEEMHARRKDTRFDMDFVLDIAQKLETVKEIRMQLKYISNQSIYKINETYNYIEFEYAKQRRIYKTAQIDINPYLEIVFKATNSPTPYQNLVNALMNFDESLSEDEIQDFLDELINEQLLFSELQPAVIGSLPWNHIYEITEELQLKSRESLDLRDTIRNLHNSIEDFNLNQKAPTDQYKTLTEMAQRIIPEIKTNRLIQVDSFLSKTDYTLGINIKEQLHEVHDLLLHFTETIRNQNLIDFTGIFIEKYGYKEMPLLDVLDTNFGIGYPAKKPKDYAPFLEKIKLWNHGNTSKKEQKQTIYWSKSEDLLLKSILEAHKNKTKVIDLAEKDISWKKNQELPETDTFQALFSIIGQDTGEGQQKLELHAMGGGSAINLISRFALADSTTNQVTQEIVRFEKDQKPDGVVAEIAHLAEDRLGNVILRPEMRDYQIPFLSRSVNNKTRLPLSDLTISIDKASNTVILKSVALNCKIYPRLSNAHNYLTSDQPPYRFLCELQNQGFQPSLNFRWRSLETIFEQLPRVVYKDIVLSKATWNLDYKDYQELLSAKTEGSLNLWRQKWELPQRFLLADRDNELLVDTNSELSIQAFLGAIRKRKKIKLKEFLFDDKTCPVKNVDAKPFVNQFIAFFQNAKNKTKNEPESVEAKEVNTQFPLSKLTKSLFPMAVEWLYFKLYCNPNNADSILINDINQISQELLKEGLIDHWFFIRYGDPGFHLRLRFHAKSQQNMGDIFETVSTRLHSLTQNGLVTNISIDSYEREVERYWGDSILECERIFFSDSQAVTKLVAVIDESQNEALRWQYSVLIMDQYLKLARHESLSDKINFTKRNVDYFGKEFGLNKSLRRQLDSKYRNLKDGFWSLNKKNRSSPIEMILSELSDNTRPLFDKIIQDHAATRSKADFSFLLSSLVHMSMNRIWPVKGRFHEFIMYYLAHKNYQSMQARLKYDKTFEIS